MKKLLAIAAVVAMTLIGAGCKQTDKDIFPLTVGSTWTYQGYALEDDFDSDTFATTTTDVEIIREASLLSGETVSEILTSVTIHIATPETTITSTSTSFAREAGDVVLSYTSLSDSTGDTLIVKDLSVGKQWSQGTQTAEVVAQEAVTVPAGSYTDAWKVRLGDPEEGTYHWYVLGIGLVKMNYSFEMGSGSMEAYSELTTVDIK